MNWNSFSPVIRAILLLGSAVYLLFILFLLKKRRLTVKYAIIWLLSAGVLIVFSLFPYVVLVLTDLLGMTNASNTVFLLAGAFILMLLISLSSAVSQFAQKITRLAQKNALLEERVRRLEEALNALLQKKQP